MKTRLLLIATAFIVLALGGVALFFGMDGIKSLWSMKDAVVGWCQSNPWVLFAALVILPAFGFPASALLLLAGATWGTTAKGCGIAILGSALNIAWTYLAAAGPARRLVGRILGTRWDRWREMDRGNLFKLTVIMRITPGLPLCVQNYVLGLLAVPFAAYLLISIPLNAVFVVGFVLTGGSIFEGKAGTAIAGVSVLIAAVLIIHLLRSRLRSTGAESIPDA